MTGAAVLKAALAGAARRLTQTLVIFVVLAMATTAALVGLTLAYRQLGQSAQAEACWQSVKTQLPLLGRRRWFAEQCLTRWQGPLEEAMNRLL